MCGIYMAALVKEKNAGESVFSGLKKIEYRGYDSWGVAVLNGNEFAVKKKVGKLSGTKQQHFVPGSIALGHTRWATHGGVTEVNAHPHLAKNGSFALVQNGVVENFQELRDELLDWGYEFESETDTEVIVGLLERLMEKQGISEPTQQSVQEVFQKLSGRNTIAVLTNSGNVFAVRSGSPLVVGKNTDTGAVYFSSDTISMSGDATEYAVIQSGQMVCFVGGKLKALDVKTSKAIKLQFVPLTHGESVIDTGEYDTFMMKEIHEQATLLHNVVSGKKAAFSKAVSALKKADTVFTLGAGTASFAAQHTAYLLRKQGIHAMSVASYEADSYRSLFTSKSVCIAFSQSGETADTNEVIEWMKDSGVKILSVVNMPGSTLTQLSDIPFMLDVGPELAVASTKAFFGHVLWGMTISALLNKLKLSEIEDSIHNFEHTLEGWFANEYIQKKIQKLAENLQRKQHLFVLGRGDLYAASLESALKLKEISYIHAEGFSGGELKHGVIALIEKGTPVLCLVAEDENKANMLNAIAEVNARGGYTIVVASQDNELYKEWIEVPESGGGEVTLPFMTLYSIVPAQLLTCYMASIKGFDVDKPRNLAKSVTVK